MEYNLIIGIVVILFVVLYLGYRITLRLLWEWRTNRAGKQIAKHTIDEIDKMDGYEFESYLDWFFRYMGYQVQNTPDSNDFGADLLLRGEEGFIVVQAKNYNDNVGIESVYQALLGIAYWASKLGGDKSKWSGYVVTNSYFTASAREASKAINSVKWLPNVELKDRNWLVGKLEEWSVENTKRGF